MKKQNEDLTNVAILRQKAAERLKMQQSKKSSLLSETDLLKLIYELEVHQIELEMQNEELLQAKEKAEIAEDKYTELYDFAPSGYLSLTKDGRITELNFVAAKMLGKERLQFTKNEFAIFLSENTRSVFSRFFDKVFTSKIKQTCEVTIETEGNLPIFVDIEGIISKNDELCQLTMLDITERTLAENKNKEIAKNWQITFDSIDDLILLLSPDHDIIEINKAGLAFINKTREEVVDKKCFTLIHNTDCSIINCACDISFKENKIVVNEYTQDNRTYELTACPVFDKKKNIQAFTHVIKDITDRKNAEIDLINAREHAEESDHLKSAFLANMSHEIRTPMNGILGFASLLQEPGLSGETQQDYIRIIEKSGVRMLNIINDIVNISKIEAGLMTINWQNSNVNEQIEYIYTFFKPEVEGKGLELSFRNALTSQEAIIRTDREKVFAILTNLVKNAIKYTLNGSIEMGYTVETGHALSLQFFVRDTGIGIPKDRQEAIFERFIQADNENLNAREGAGLGLAITKSYVEMLGGKIWVESEVGLGSTFYFTLPYNAEPVEEIIVQPLAPSDNTNYAKKLKILIAEDDEVSAMLMSININEFGKEILKVRTGAEAVEACRENPNTDLILMDINMPEMDGYEATRQIREFNKVVVIIAQTAYGLAGDKEKAIDAGCNDYIAKPIIKDELLSLIQKYFNK